MRRFYNGIGSCNWGGVILDLFSTHHYSDQQNGYVLSAPRIFKINIQGVSIKKMDKDGYYNDYIKASYFDHESIIRFSNLNNRDIVQVVVFSLQNMFTFSPPKHIEDISIYCEYIDEGKFNMYIYVDGEMVSQSENSDDRHLKMFLNPAATISVSNLYVFESMDSFIVSEVKNVGD